MTKRDTCPEPDSKVYFGAATAYVERVHIKKRKVKISGAHRGFMATLDNGYILIDRKWYS